jgi:hypothetical protein
MPTVTIQAKLENLFYPYVIQQAIIEAALLSGKERMPVRVEPTAVKHLQPGAEQPVEVSFSLPMAQVPSAWSVQALTAMGKQVLLPLTVEMGLTGQHLALSEGFADKLRELFPGDPISEMFTPPNSVKASHVRVPLLVRIQYPLTPVLALVGALLAVVGGLAALSLSSSSSKRYEVVVDGKKRNVMLKPFASLAITDGEGRSVGAIKRCFGRPHVVSMVEGHSVSLIHR